MSNLTKALDDYKMAFQKKLDAYQALELDIPTLNEVEHTKRAEDLQTPQLSQKTKKTIFEPLGDLDLVEDTPSQATPPKQKTKDTTSLSNIQRQPFEPKPKITITPPTVTLSEPNDSYSPPPSSLSHMIKPRHIIHRTVQSFGFRFSFGLLLLLLL
jgi:hypothetical protein